MLWSRPFLPPLEPLAHDAALQTFIAISDVAEDNADLQLLLDAVDRMPLAITLMASMAQYESCSTLIARWNELKTSMLQRNTASRISSVDVSIQLSLSCPRMHDVPGALELLSALSLLPDGAETHNLPLMLPSLSTVPAAISTLLRTALAYRLTATRVRVLTPIRQYVQIYHPPTGTTLADLHGYCVAQVTRISSLWNTADANLAHSAEQTEGTNFDAVFTYCLERGMEPEITIRSIVDLGHTAHNLRARSPAFFDKALDHARALGLKSLQARCLRAIAILWTNQHPSLNPTELFQLAIDTAVESNDLEEEARCLLVTASRPPSLASQQWNNAQAQKRAERAMLISAQLGLTDLSASASSVLGELADYRGDNTAAVAQYRQSIRLHLQCPVPDQIRLFRVYRRLAAVKASTGDLKVGIAMLEKALQIADATRNPTTIVPLLGELGYYEFLRSNLTSAEKHLTRARDMLFEAKIVNVELELHTHFLLEIHLATYRPDQGKAGLERYTTYRSSFSEHAGLNTPAVVTARTHESLSRVEIYEGHSTPLAHISCSHSARIFGRALATKPRCCSILARRGVWKGPASRRAELRPLRGAQQLYQ